MPNPNIGTITCPACDFPDAAVRESAKGKAYVVCDECGSQTFARGEKSDASIRRRMKPCAAPAAVAPAAPAAAAPKAKRAAPKPKAAPAAEPAPAVDPFRQFLGL